MSLVLFVSFFACVVAVFASPLNETEPRATCTVQSYDDVQSAVSGCSTIVIDGITVPGGKTLQLSLKDGTSLTFQGHITWDYKEWGGPLMEIKGKDITVKGASGHILDGQGEKYWDGLGGNGGKTKPKFLHVGATGGSVVDGLNVLNCPKHCISLNGCNGLTVSNWNIDCSAGDAGQKGHNTDGFDISSSHNLVLQNTVVKNQDDCVVVNHGSNITVTGMTCSGGHGLSLSVGMSKTSSDSNTVSNIRFLDSTVMNSANGIHVKTHSDGASGSVKDVTYSNIKLSGITNYGINIQEDYENGGSSGKPKGNIPITGLTMKGITGTMSGSSSSMPVYILCGDGGCSNWSWGSISITGNKKSSSCNYNPSGYSC